MKVDKIKDMNEIVTTHKVPFENTELCLAPFSWVVKYIHGLFPFETHYNTLYKTIYDITALYQLCVNNITDSNFIERDTVKCVS